LADLSGEIAMASASLQEGRLGHVLAGVGDVAIFAARTLGWLVRRRPPRGTILTSCYEVGVRSVGVIVITGTFIGMVLAVQSYAEFRSMGLESRIGTIINVSVVRELGPVLAATMLAGRIGGAIAAELATMRISEQIDALACLAINPIHFLVVPRFIACVLVIPLLTIIADFMGVLGGWLIAVPYYGVEAHYYWTYTHLERWDIAVGLFKSLFFGAAIGLISCHRGFRSRPGAQGVGQASTEAFVFSFIAILALDFILAMFANALYARLWPDAGSRLL
jgi:phospholipid/cholesterol/gamma-HCH transport system permease protein